MDVGDVVSERFRLEERAGAGGMGVVFRARDLTTDTVVALKLLTVSGAIQLARFEREASLLRSLAHPGIVRFVAHGSTEAGLPYLAMEWLEGQDLAARLLSRSLRVDEVLVLGAHIAESLAYLHERGVVHRDLKPSNVFLVRSDVEAARLLDLGIAGVTGGTRITRTGLLLGTPSYMSPEQARGEPDIDPRTDVFALGCLLYECLAGRPAFEGEAAIAILAKVIFADPPGLRELAPFVPEGLEHLLMSMLAKSRHERPADGAEVHRLLATCVESGTGTIADGPVARDEGPRDSRLARERQIVSVVVARAGSEPATPISMAADAETMSGASELLVDGSRVWLFRSDGDATASAVAAARTALAAKRIMPSARVGLATGHALLGARLPVGDVTERAVALTSSSVGHVVLDTTTERLLPVRFEVRELDANRELVSEVESELGARRLLGRATPFVGRDAELAVARAASIRAFEEGRAAVVLFRGEPGIGKSRLLSELLDRLGREHAQLRVLRGNGDPARGSTPFGVIESALRLGLAIGPEVGSVEALVDALLPIEERRRVRSFLREVMRVRSLQLRERGVRSSESLEVEAARIDPQLLIDQIHRAVADVFSALAARGPLAIVLEDIHFADAPSVKLIDTMLRSLRAAPFLVLATARPSIDDAYPGLFKERGVHVVRVGPLPRGASLKLAKAVLDGAQPERLEWVLGRAQGNAFFLEELLRAMVEGESDLDGVSSIHALVEARFARLSAGARRLLRIAAVFGDRAPSDGVAAILGDDPAATGNLAELESHELLEREARGGAGDLVFRHALVREAAYAALVDEDRALAHRLAAEFFETKGSIEASRLAEHYELGGVASRAATLWLRAAERALEAQDASAALSTLARARKCGLDEMEERDALVLESSARLRLGEIVPAARAAESAMAMLTPGSRAWLEAAANAASAFDRMGDAARVREVGEQALRSITPSVSLSAYYVASIATSLVFVGAFELGDQLAGVLDRSVREVDELVRYMISGYRGAIALSRGDFPAGIREFGRAAEAARTLTDRRRLATVSVNRSVAMIRAGAFAEAEALLGEAIEHATALGLDGVEIYARCNLGEAYRGLSRLSEARRELERAIDMAVRFGERRAEAGGRFYLTRVLVDLGALDDAEREARAAVSCAVKASPGQEPAARALLARILAKRDLPAAMVEVRRIRELLGTVRAPGDEIEVGGALMALTAAADGIEAASEDARALRAAIAAQAALFEDDGERARFLATPVVAEALEALALFPA